MKRNHQLARVCLIAAGLGSATAAFAQVTSLGQATTSLAGEVPAITLLGNPDPESPYYIGAWQAFTWDDNLFRVRGSKKRPRTSFPRQPCAQASTGPLGDSAFSATASFATTSTTRAASSTAPVTVSTSAGIGQPSSDCRAHSGTRQIRAKRPLASKRQWSRPNEIPSEPSNFSPADSLAQRRCCHWRPPICIAGWTTRRSSLRRRSSIPTR